MAKFLESEKRRLANNYVQSLYSLYEKGDLTETDMDLIIEDVEVIAGIFPNDLWRKLTYMTNRFSLGNEEISKLFANAVYPHLSSGYTKKWIDEHIQRNHFTIIERSIKTLLKKVLLLDVETPEYISITPERKSKILGFVKKFYREKIFNNGKSVFIKLHFNKVKTVGMVEMDDDYKALANQLFDFEIKIIEKKLLTV